MPGAAIRQVERLNLAQHRARSLVLEGTAVLEESLLFWVFWAQDASRARDHILSRAAILLLRVSEGSGTNLHIP